MNIRPMVSWGLINQVVQETWRLLSKEKFIPRVIVANRPKDYIVAGMLMATSTSIKIGSVECLPMLLTAHCKLLLLSLDNDPQLEELIVRAHTSCSTLSFLYTLRTCVLFDTGHPVYDLATFSLPYQPLYPWEPKRDREGSV